MRWSATFVLLALLAARSTKEEQRKTKKTDKSTEDAWEPYSSHTRRDKLKRMLLSLVRQDV
jgi:hypothetical protein